MKILYCTFRTFLKKDQIPNAFVFGKLNKDFEIFSKKIVEEKPDLILGIAKANNSRFERVAINQFKKIKPTDILDYQNLFVGFLEEKGNEEAKNRINSYNKAKLVSYLDISSMLEIGENEQIEFKEKVTSSLYRGAISFSNTLGGKILVGVSNNGEVIGLSNLKEEYDKAINTILGNTNPKINPVITTQKVEGKEIMVIEIYRFSKAVCDNDNNFFIRKGSINTKASKEELIKLFKERGES